MDWDAVFEGADWFHWTGITPAISASAALLCLDAVEAARKHGVKISGGINIIDRVGGGDENFVSVDEVNQLIKGENVGKLLR